VLNREQGSGIPVDHPKNPAVILNNISLGYLRTIENCLEFNALTNMGLCLFQDFFVIKTVFIMDRGYLNALAIYSLGMVGSLCSMLHFRRLSKFKISESSEITTNFSKLRSNGLISINLAAVQIMISSFFVFWNTFPDSVAVYNPFRSEIGLRGVLYEDAFFIFSMGFIIIISLVLNSIWFTGPLSKTQKNLHEFSNVAFSLNLIKSDYWSYWASIFPILTFFFVILVAYTYANAFGVALIYLGVITFYQIIQFFQNLKHTTYHYLAILMAAKPVHESAESNLDLNFQ